MVSRRTTEAPPVHFKPLVKGKTACGIPMDGGQRIRRDRAGGVTTTSTNVHVTTMRESTTCKGCLRVLSGDEQILAQLTRHNVFIPPYEPPADPYAAIVERIFRSLPARAAMRAIAKRAIHPDDIAVDVFAAEIKDRMHKQRLRGEADWRDMKLSALLFALKECVANADTIGAATFAMLAYHSASQLNRGSNRG